MVEDGKPDASVDWHRFISDHAIELLAVMGYAFAFGMLIGLLR